MPYNMCDAENRIVEYSHQSRTVSRIMLICMEFGMNELEVVIWTSVYEF